MRQGETALNAIGVARVALHQGLGQRREGLCEGLDIVGAAW
jgi:hypothetical protein